MKLSDFKFVMFRIVVVVVLILVVKCNFGDFFILVGLYIK